MSGRKEGARRVGVSEERWWAAIVWCWDIVWKGKR